MTTGPQFSVKVTRSALTYLSSLGLKRRSHHDVNSTSFGTILKVQRDQVGSQTTIVGFVDTIQDEVQQVEPRNQRWRKIDIARDRPVQVVLGSHRISGSEN